MERTFFYCIIAMVICAYVMVGPKTVVNNRERGLTRVMDSASTIMSSRDGYILGYGLQFI